MAIKKHWNPDCFWQKTKAPKCDLPVRVRKDSFKGLVVEMAQGAMQAKPNKTRSNHARAVEFQERLSFAGLQREHRALSMQATHQLLH
jgi:hypothetical protein